MNLWGASTKNHDVPDTVGSLYNKPFDFYFNRKKELVFKQPEIITAKLSLVDKFFMPSLDNCYFNDIVLDLETSRIDVQEIELQLKSEKKYKWWFGGAGLVVGVLVTSFFVNLFK